MIKINEDICIKCGSCKMDVENEEELVDICPVGALSIEEDEKDEEKTEEDE